VKLTATTKNLCSDYITKKITVYPKPSAAINPVLDRGCSPLTANLINKSKVSSPATFLWDFDNGVTKNLTQISTEEPNYINDGDKAEVKNVQLIVITNSGCSDTVVQLVNVYPKANASFIPTKTAGCSPLEVTFRNLSNTTSTVYKWNFGNGATSQQREPVYRYINDTDNDQVYTVTLNVESPFGCADTIQRDITVYLSPNAEFVVVEPIKLYPDTVLSFQNQVKPGPWTFDWDYGDGQFSNETDKVHEHVYTGWGPRDKDFSYIVWLTAYSDFCRDSISQVVTINPPKPEINILQRNQTGCEPLIVAFDVGYRYGYKDSVKWNFGDGIPGSGIQTEHEYGNAGLYISTVTIKGDGGIAIDTTKIYVWPLPQPSFEFRPDFVMLPSQPAFPFAALPSVPWCRTRMRDWQQRLSSFFTRLMRPMGHC
jgi:PKD repeat protein